MAFGSLLKTEHMGKPWNNESAEKWWKKPSSTNSARPRSGDVLGNVVVVVVCFVCCCCGVVSLLSARVNQGLKYQGLPKGGHYSTVNATSEDSQQGWCVWGVSAWFGNGGGCAGVREEGWGGESRWAVRSGGVLAVRRRYPPGPTGASFFQPPLRILLPPRLFREVCCHRPRRRPSRHPRRRSSRRRRQIDR